MKRRGGSRVNPENTSRPRWEAYEVCLDSIDFFEALRDMKQDQMRGRVPEEVQTAIAGLQRKVEQEEETKLKLQKQIERGETWET